MPGVPSPCGARLALMGFCFPSPAAGLLLFQLQRRPPEALLPERRPPGGKYPGHLQGELILRRVPKTGTPRPPKTVGSLPLTLPPLLWSFPPRGLAVRRRPAAGHADAADDPHHEQDLGAGRAGHAHGHLPLLLHGSRTRYRGVGASPRGRRSLGCDAVGLEMAWGGPQGETTAGLCEPPAMGFDPTAHL